MLQRFATATPIALPASPISRWAAASPAAESSSSRRVEISSRRLRRAARRSPRAEASVSRQPRLPQRQTGPSSATSVWPISPAVPPTPWVRRPPEIRPPPMPGGDLDVGDLGSALCRAPGQLGEGAEVGVVLDLDRQAERRAAPRPQRRCRPSRAGSRSPAPCPVARLIGAGRPITAPITRLAVDPRLLRAPGRRTPPRRQALVAGVVDVHLAPGLGEHGVGEVGDRDPQVAVAEVDREREARRSCRARPSRRGGRRAPRRPAGRRARRARPDSIRSPTIVEIVDRERSVIRASSARLATPRSRSASITRRRLPSRSDASEPLFPLRTAALVPHTHLFVKP